MNAAVQLDFATVARLALGQAESLLLAWFPAGRCRGHEFVVGNLAGDAGESLSININTGAWGDFASSERGGDLISLYAAIHHLGQGDALRQLAAELGVPITRHPAGSAKVIPMPSRDEHADADWSALLPVPPDAPPPPAAHPKHGVPAYVARYRSAPGDLLYLVYRFEPEGQRKQFSGVTFWRHQSGRTEWRFKSPLSPRPLYGLPELAADPDQPVLIVEGERKRDAAQQIVGDRYACVTWPNGASSAAKADWSVMAGRDAVMWPDADAPGQQAAAAVSMLVRQAGGTLRVVPPPDGVPEGWDVGDAIAEGWTAERIAAHLAPVSETPPEAPPDDYEGEPEPEAFSPHFVPMGHDRGRFYFYGRAGGQVRDFSARDLTGLGGLLEIAPLPFWEREFPSKTGPDLRAAGATMIQQCHQAGIYDPDRLRGRGAWLDEGKAVLHLGDRLLIDGVDADLGALGGYAIYERARRLPVDFDAKPLGAAQAVRLMELCKSLPFDDAESMGRLLAGWCVIAPVCGAMPWRPHLWLISEAGGGKAQPHSAAIMTRHGWRTMGDLRPGDCVRTPDGGYGRILKVHPQGVQPTYRFTFADGRITRATLDHLWKVREQGEWRLRTTEQIVATLGAKGHNARTLAIPLPEAIETADRPCLLPVHPYVIGVLLGDGHLANDDPSKKSGEIRITSADPDIVAKVAALLPTGISLHKTNEAITMRMGDLSRYGRKTRETIKGLRLLGTRSHTKFVPPEYLKASVADRWELLRGLMDTDGTVSPNGALSFTSTSAQLATDVQYLVRSLGGTAKHALKNSRCLYKGEMRGSDSHHLSIRLRTPEMAFGLARKQARVPVDYQYADSFYLGIESIELDEPEECSCISIDHPDRLYITDNFVVTHNTWVWDNIVRPLLGAVAMRVQSKTTEAFLRQRLGSDALPVLFDEFESQNDRDRDRIQQVLDLARQASSEDGAEIGKGGQDGRARSYRIRSCFAFASINLGLSQSADESRTVVLTLRPNDDAAARAAAFVKLKALHGEIMQPGFAPALLSRTLRLLPTIRANAETFAQAISRTAGRRTGDTVGVLLAGAWSLRSSKLATAEEAAKFVDEEQWVQDAMSRSAAEPEWRRALTFLAQQMIRVVPKSGKPEDVPVGELLELWDGRNQPAGTDSGQPPVVSKADAQTALTRSGIRLDMDAAEATFYVASGAEQVRRWFADSPWATGWAATLARAPGVTKMDKSKRFGSLVSKGLAIPLQLLLGVEDE